MKLGLDKEGPYPDPGICLEGTLPIILTAPTAAEVAAVISQTIKATRIMIDGLSFGP